MRRIAAYVSGTNSEKIERCNIRNLSKEMENHTYLVVYGCCLIENKKYENGPSPQKQLLFKLNDKLRFSIFLTPNQSDHAP